MHTKNNYKEVFVARNCARTTGVTSNNIGTKLAYGELVVVDDKGQLVDTAAKATAAKAIRFIIGTKDESNIISDLIVKKDLKEVISSKFEQRVNKRVVIGYNGTAGDIVLMSANKYVVEIKHALKGRFPNSAYSVRAAYESMFTGDTKFNVLRNLAELLALDYAQFNTGVRINVISDQAVAGGMTGVEVVRGSNSLSYTGGAAPAVGDVIEIPGITGGTFRDEVDSLYQVKFVDTTLNLVELDRPYQNRDNDGLAVGILANPAVGAYGLTVEGMDLDWQSKYDEYSLMDFAVWTLGFEGATISDKGATYAGVQGFGRHEQVIESEYNHGDGDGRYTFAGRGFELSNINTDLGTGYSLVTIVFDHVSAFNNMNLVENKKEVDVFLQRGTYADIKANAAGTAFGTNIQTGTGLSTVDGDSFLNVLNAFAVDAGVLNAGVNTKSNGGNEITAGTTYNSGIDV